MLTRQGVVAETCCVETMPFRLITTEDGRTLLAMTEHKDGMLEIVAAPVTLIAQNGTAPTSLDVKNLDGNFIVQPPFFQINVEDNVSGFQQTTLLPTQTLETVPIVLERLESCIDTLQEATVVNTILPVPTGNDALPDTKNKKICERKSAAAIAKRTTYGRSPGRPNKNGTASSNSTEKLRCDICQQEFTKQMLYRKHMESHAEEKPHRCPKCPASFNIPTNFTLHMATHNVGDPKCPECGRKFARMASLKSHMLLHEKEENLFCTECEDAFSTKAQLDAHLKLHGEKWSTEETRKCKLCNKQFVQPALYRLHIREHYRLQTKVVKQTKRGAKHKTMYKCTICLKSFQKPSQLMRHIRVHTGEKPFKCTVCGRAFTQKSSLQIHTWQHNGIRPHTCDLCNAKFSQKGNLNAHILRVHNAPEGEPIYGCTYCSCIFKKLGSLNGHIKRMHTDEGQAMDRDHQEAGTTEADMRATVDSVISQLASLESNTATDVNVNTNNNHPSGSQPNMASAIATKKDILQQALKNSGLPNTLETKKLDARTNFVTLLDRAPDGDTRKYLTIRQRCVGNVKWYACSFCHKEFKKPSDLIRHLRIHTQEKPFKCTFCYRSFALKSTMIAHERTHTGAKKHACGSCDKTFACHTSLAAHARLHAKPDESNNGNEDGGEIRVEKARGKHHSSWRGKPKLSPEAESLVPQVVLQEPLVISDTGSKICVSQVQSKQKQSNDGTTDVARPHKCWVCHAAFRKISHLKQHYLRHTGERPYKCVKCERRFTSNSVLKSHLHTHEDSRPYSCSVCGTQFSTQSSMKRHLITHSNKRPFMCPYCHKTFKTYVNCRKHMKIHKHELAQRQLEQQKRLDTQEQSGGEVTLIQDAKEVSPSISTSTSSTVLTDNLSLARYETIEMSFQSPLPSDFPQTFSDQFRNVTSEKDKTSLSESLPEPSVTNIGSAQMLHADETGTVTLPAYSQEQALTPESIRDLEETLNQQLFNVGLNFGLGNNLSNKQISNGNAGEQESCREQEQRPVLNVIYENSKNIDSTGTNIFASQFDSFDMSHISLQPSGEIDMANSTNMASILPRSAKEVQQPSIPVSAIPMASNGQLRASPTRNRISNESELQERNKDAFLAEEFRGTMQDLRTQSEVQTTSADIVGVNVINAKVTPPESLLQCHMCSEQGFTATGLKEHLKTHRGTKEYQCPDCPLKFCTNGGLSRHAKTHASKLWVIDDSIEIFRIDDNLSDLSYHDSYTKQWKCSLCEKVFSNKEQLRSHGKVHDAGWCVASSELDDTENERVLVSSNVKTTTGIESDSTVSEKVLMDTVAEKEVMDRTENALERKERKEYTNKCKYCPKTFRKPSDLIRHTRTHTGERPYKCDYCSKSFAVKCTLDSHTKVHTGKKTFRCHVCSSLFSTKGSLKVHMRLHTGSKPFRCPVCDLRFRTSGHRKVHLLKHVREHKGNPRRKQKHLKVAAIAEVAASFEKSNESVEMTIPTEAVTTPATQTTYEQQQHELPQNIAAYPSLEVIGIEPAALTDQITFETDGTISNNNTILSVNESNHLVTNLQYLLANGLFTIQTEETLLTQPPADRVRTFKNVIVQQHDENEEISEAIQVPSAQLPIGTCLLNTAVATPARVEPAVRIATKTVLKGGNQSKKECDVCGKTFMKPYQVERHKRIHTGERPYKCDLCTKSFAQKSTLQMHQKHHTGDRPHPCPHCEYSFTQKGNLRTHVKRVHQLDTLDMKKLRRSGQCFAPKSLQENLTDPKILSLDDISFVELLK